MYTEKWRLPISLLGLIALLTIYSHTLYAQPHGMMRHGMDDEEYMERMMGDRGYMGPGYGGGYRWRHMGPMMGGPMGMMMGPMMGQLYGLDLSKEQRDKVRSIHRKVRKQHFALMDKMMDQSDKLYDLYSVDKPDPEQIGKVYDEIYKIKREMIKEHITVRNQIYDLLTKEQREKFKKNDPFLRHFGMMQ